MFYAVKQVIIADNKRWSRHYLCIPGILKRLCTSKYALNYLKGEEEAIQMCFIFLLPLPEIPAGVTPELLLMPWPAWTAWYHLSLATVDAGNYLENYIREQQKEIHKREVLF